MSKVEKYLYKLRSGYGSEELLLEFDAKNSPDELQIDLTRILEQNGFIFQQSKSILINNELLFVFGSENGTVSLSRDHWDFFFILGENNNQADILRLDQILSENILFEKQETDNSKHRS